MEKHDQPAPTMNKGKWTDEEQAIFVDSITKHGRNYDVICATIKTRTKVQIYTHVQSHFAKLESVATKRARKDRDVARKVAEESGGKRKRKSVINKPAKKIVIGVS